MKLRDQSGFTLLELLVALAVFGLLLTELAQVTHFALTARAVQVRQVEMEEDLDVVDRAVRRLIGTMDSSPFQGPTSLIGTAHSMSFTADLPKSESLAASQADVVVMVDSAHRLDTALGTPLRFANQSDAVAVRDRPTQ